MNIKKYVHFVISFFYWYYCLSLGWKSKKLSPNSLWPHGLYSPWNAPGQNTGVGSLSLLQRIFLIWGSNPGLRHCRWILHQLSHKGSPRTLEWVAYPFFRESSRPRNRTGVSCIAGGFFTNWAIREAQNMYVFNCIRSSLGHAGYFVEAHGLSSYATWAFIVAAGWFCCSVACGILVSQPGIEPTSPALQGRFLTTAPPGKLSLGQLIMFTTGKSLKQYYDIYLSVFD